MKFHESDTAGGQEFNTAIAFFAFHAIDIGRVVGKIEHQTRNIGWSEKKRLEELTHVTASELRALISNFEYGRVFECDRWTIDPKIEPWGVIVGLNLFSTKTSIGSYAKMAIMMNKETGLNFKLLDCWVMVEQC